MAGKSEKGEGRVEDGFSEWTRARGPGGPRGSEEDRSAITGQQPMGGHIHQETLIPTTGREIRKETKMTF